MATTAKQQFAARLVSAMRDEGYASKRGASSGVDVGPLSKKIGVTREMARRYCEGTALPDLNKMQLIADWLKVRLPWLRDGEGDRRAATAEQRVAQADAPPYLTDDAVEIARMWMKLPTDKRAAVRDILALEAVVATHYPWLAFGRPKSESYTQYEQRVEHDLLRIASRLTTPGK